MKTPVKLLLHLKCYFFSKKHFIQICIHSNVHIYFIYLIKIKQWDVKLQNLSEHHRMSQTAQVWIYLHTKEPKKIIEVTVRADRSITVKENPPGVQHLEKTEDAIQLLLQTLSGTLISVLPYLVYIISQVFNVDP